MNEGKLNWNELTELISKNRGALREEVRIKSGVGEDCSVVTFSHEECVLSTDPITGAGKGVGKLAFHINMNDIASSGAEPLGIMVTILAPVDSSYEDILETMKEIHNEALKYNVEIIGGHTEVTSAVNRMIVSCTAIGKNKRGSSVATKGCREGDSIIVTKELCLEGTAIAAYDYEEYLKNYLSVNEIEEAKECGDSLSVIKEGRTAHKFSEEFGLSSMHDITEGGLLGALWEVMEAAGKGFRIYDEKLPLREVSKKVCEALKIEPLKFISSGSMLITCRDGEKMKKKLFENGINAHVIGEITQSGGVLVKEDKEMLVDAPDVDELFKINI